MEFEIDHDCSEEFAIEELILVFLAGSFNHFSDGEEALGDEIVVANVDGAGGILLVLVFEDFPDATHDVKVGCGA